MATGHPKIPKDIDDELSPRARKFFYELIDNYELEILPALSILMQNQNQIRKSQTAITSNFPANSN